jgi:hypothetical protein
MRKDVFHGQNIYKTPNPKCRLFLKNWRKDVFHGQNIYKTPNPKCRLFLKNWQQVFICQRPPIPSPPPVTYCMNTPVLIHTGKGGGR